jgi:asparagine synthase (glutamine-hydrolysing)
VCGIAGLYDLPEAMDRLDGMVASLTHRGPDAGGVHVVDRPRPVALGHRRLSIIDLSRAADQPLTKDGLTVVFNGEIYNYRSLRHELDRLGIRFRTDSDTEVLLEAWRAWGPGALARLRGMFAFALLDEPSGRLVLARDPFGIKPLFWTERHGGVAFASELKALAAAFDDLEIDHRALVASLLYYWVPESHCVYRSVSKLPPGTWLELNPGAAPRLHRYYDPAAASRAAVPPVGADELREVIARSVEAHLVADVPVGAFLSGGLDSSLITVLAARTHPGLDCFTIGFRAVDQRFEAMPDDLHHARRLADRHGLRLHEIEIAPDVAGLLPRLVEILDEPIGDAAAVNAYLVSAAARDAGLKVLLSGMGADELFGGYRKHYACLLAARYRRLPRFLRERTVTPAVRRLPVGSARRGYRWSRWAHRFLDFSDESEEAAFRRSYTHYAPAELARLVGPELAPAIDELVEEHARIYWEGPSDDQVNRMCQTDLRLFLPGLNLAYTDRVSMAASVEVRVPFVDRDVVAAALAIPGTAKIRGRRTKAVLKDAARPLLPSDIVSRPKAPFSAPLRAWIRRDLREMVDDCVAGGALVNSGLLDRQSVRAMIDDDRRGVADRSKEIWHLLTLEAWYQNRITARAAVR